MTAYSDNAMNVDRRLAASPTLSYVSARSERTSSWASVTAHQNLVIIRPLSHTTSDVEKLLRQTKLDTVTRNTLVEDRPVLSITLTFDHPYMAAAAATIIQHRGGCMFSEARPIVAGPVDAELALEPPEDIEQVSTDYEIPETITLIEDEDDTSMSGISVGPSATRSTSATQTDSNSGMVLSGGNDLESPGITVTPLPVAPYSKARRILLPEESKQPLLTVSMRADINFVCQLTKLRIAKRSVPNDSDPCRVVDAVLLKKHALIGFNGKTSQVAILRINDKDERCTFCKLPQLAHTLPKQDTRHKVYTSAITCITGQAEQDECIKFFTGGSDKDIRLWTTTPQAFAYTGDITLLVGSSTRLYTIDLNRPSALVTARMSNGIHNILLHKQAPMVRILEVDHIDYQTQVFDHRKESGFGRPPDISFGARAANGVPNRRHSRGDTSLSLYAKGSSDGTVKIWDYRNAKSPMIAHSFQRAAKVTHTVFADPSTLICYSDRELMFIDLNRVPN